MSRRRVPQSGCQRLALGTNQYWNVGPGGVTVAAVATGSAGYLLEIDGSGTASIHADRA